jgi:hypothetical protein
LKRGLRVCAALLLAALAAAAPPARGELVQAVEFPYYLYPPNLWERELVWLKTIGIHTVEFSIPWNWHQVAPGDFDFTGRTSPRRDLAGFIKLLRRVGVHGWARTAPPVDAWPNRGFPAGVSPASLGAMQAWQKALAGLLAAQTVSHGGAIAFVEGALPGVDAPAPPLPVRKLAGDNPDALAFSRNIIATEHGALVWTGIEDALYPAGWAASAGVFLRKGAVGLAGDERGATVALRRDAALLRAWGPILGSLQPAPIPKPAAGKFPAGVTAAALISHDASAVSIANRSAQPFQDDLSLTDPSTRRAITIPAVRVPAGESLWLPVGVSLSPKALCSECSNFSGVEQIVFATAELLSIEYENGILAMEFTAPEAGAVTLQLERRPVGPYLAAGKPIEFEWDDKAMRARLPIPKSTAPDHRVRIGIAMEEPEISAFFDDDSKRLIIGAKNVVSTTYSSPEVAARSRLRLPEGFVAAKIVKSPNEIEYEIAVPADAAQGDYANFALEADGVPLGRARLQLFRPLTVRLMDAINIHFGQHTEMTPDPPVAPVEPKAGTNLELSLRNNWPAIQTYKLEAAGEGLEFFPAKTEITIGAVDERKLELRVFGAEGVTGLRDWHLRVTGGATLDLPMRVVIAPRGRTVAWTADLDGDGSPEWILDSPKARAIFSSQDGGRWMEFTWKDGHVNFLPEQGVFAGAGPVEVRANGDALEFAGKGWSRTVRLADAVLTVEQSAPLPADGLTPRKQGNLSMSISRPTASRASYSLSQ